MFESRVVLEGSKTPSIEKTKVSVFESRVVLEGSKTSGFLPLSGGTV